MFIFLLFSFLCPCPYFVSPTLTWPGEEGYLKTGNMTHQIPLGVQCIRYFRQVKGQWGIGNPFTNWSLSLPLQLKQPLQRVPLPQAELHHCYGEMLGEAKCPLAGIPLMKNSVSFRAGPIRCKALDMPAPASINVGSDPCWAHAHSCLSIILQRSR